LSDDNLGLGKLAEALERGTREMRELEKTYIDPIAKEKGELQADKIKFNKFKRTIQAIKIVVPHLKFGQVA
jgi:hypothetical protein